ncbi:MAG: hypothetical protein RID25_23295 [Cyclobacteriaceae bacterium]
MGRNINYGCLGNGWAVWNNAKEINGDYEKVAHITIEGQITFYPKDLTKQEIIKIEFIRNAEVPDWRIIQHLMSLGFWGCPLSKQHYDQGESCLTAYKQIPFNKTIIQARQFSTFFGYRIREQSI